MLKQVRATVLATQAFCCITVVVMPSCSRYGGSAPVGSTAPSPVQPATARDSTPDIRLSPFHPGRVVYELATISVIESVIGDSIPQTDSMRLNSVVSAEFVMDGHESQIQVAIRIDSTYLTTTFNQQQQFETVRRSYIISRSGQIQSTTTAPDACGMEADNPITGVEILPNFPAVEPPAGLWTDTTAYTLCRGGIRVQATRVAVYRRVSLADNPSALHLIRQSRVTLAGQGSQWDQPVEATGLGDSVDTLTFSQPPIRLTQITGSAQLELKFASRFRNQVLRQSSQLKAHLRP